MKHSNQRPGRPRRAYAWLLVPVLLLALGSAGAAAPVAAQGSFGTVTIQVQLVDANGAQVSGDLSNYVFTLNSGGATFPMPATNTQGSTQLGVPAGNYTLQMQPRAGVTQQGFFIGTQQVVGFSIAAGQTVTVTARNQVAGTGVIVMTKQIVDQAGTILSVTDRSGFQIQIIGPNNFTQTITTDVNGVVTLGNLAPGTYQLTEQGRAGFTFSSMTINGVSVQNGGSFNLVTGSTSQVIINNRQGGGTGTVQVTKANRGRQQRHREQWRPQRLPVHPHVRHGQRPEHDGHHGRGDV
ncbi:MAG: SpaA isopeptide-forming pilin-related protein [Dehalococcoidia bacterium]